VKRVLVLATNASDAKSLVLWGLREAGYECIALGNSSKNEELMYSPLCRNFFPIPEEYSFEEKSPEIVPLIKKVAEENNIDIIYPSGFESVKFLSLFQDELSQIKPCVPVPTLEAISQISDKNIFASFCQDHDIPHPKTYLLKDLRIIEQNSLPVQYPLLTKPLRMSASKGIYTFHEKDALLEYLKTQKEDGSNTLPLLLQEFIPGFDIDFNGFSRKGHLSAWTIQKFIEIPRKNNKSLRWIQFLKNDDILRIGKKIIAETKYSGPIHVDLRIDERNNKVVAIEVNPRFWASIFASMCDGVNFADVAVQSMLDPEYVKEPKYSNRIWGTPHRLPFLLLSERKTKFITYALQHTFLQIKFRILDKIFSIISMVRKNKGLKLTSMDASAKAIETGGR